MVTTGKGYYVINCEQPNNLKSSIGKERHEHKKRGVNCNMNLYIFLQHQMQ